MQNMQESSKAMIKDKKGRFLSLIKKLAGKTGVRSHELAGLYKKELEDVVPPGEDKKALLELAKEKKIKFVTEEWRDYCWVVPFDWEDIPAEGMISVGKIACELFGI